jgi:hypothetical protein
MFSRKKEHIPSTSAPARGLASSQVSTQQLQFPTTSQTRLQSPQEEQPVSESPWSAHDPPFGHSQSPFLRTTHALFPNATVAGELFLFGGWAQSSKSLSNDLYVISTRDFSSKLLQTSGDVPKPRYGHCAVLTSSTLLIWGGGTDLPGQNSQDQRNDDSFYLLNLGMSDFLMSRPASADQGFLRSSIARVVAHRGQRSWTRRSLQPYHDVGRFQALRLRWPGRQEAFK